VPIGFNACTRAAPRSSPERSAAPSLARFAASLRSSTCSSLCAVACACVELCAVTTHLTRPSFHLRLLAVSSDCVNRDSLPHCSVQSDPLTELTFCVGTLFPSPASCRFLVPASTTRVSRHSSRQPCVSFFACLYGFIRASKFLVLRGAFSPNPLLLFTNLPSSPHTSSHMFGHHPATVRLARRKRHARFESSEALLRLWQSCRQWRAQPWSCMDAAPGCRLQRRSSANILTAWPGRVAQAPRAGRARAPWSCSPCWRPSSRTARLRDQLGLDDEANSQMENRRRTEVPPRQPGCRWHLGRRFANFQRQRGAVQLIPQKARVRSKHPPVYPFLY
jgi:hypothetical protein